MAPLRLFSPLAHLPSTNTFRFLRPRSWLLPLLTWGGVVLAAVVIGRYAALPRGLPRIPEPASDLSDLLHRLGVGSTVWYAAAGLAPILLWGVRYVHPDRRGWLKPMALGSLVVVLLTATVSAIQYFVVYGDTTNRPDLADYLAAEGPVQLLFWLALSGGIIGLEGRRRSGQAALERERLRTQLAEQRLIALTAQLHPHFLFNTLQGVSTLIHRNPDGADELLGKLCDLLREVLRQRDRILVPLGEELRFAKTYLEIGQLRFGDRLTFAIDAPDALLAVTVPVFLLQPLIENAVTHGIGGTLEGGSITIRVCRDEQQLRLEVADDGAGLPSGLGSRDGFGLGNTRHRLQAVYGDRSRLQLRPGSPRGAVATVLLPIGVRP